VVEAGVAEATDPLAPQPVSAARVRVKAAIASSCRVFGVDRLRRLERRAPITGSSKGKIAAAERGARLAVKSSAGLIRAAWVVGAFTVMTTEALPPGVRVGIALKAQEPPGGSPEHESPMVPEKMPTELRVS